MTDHACHYCGTTEKELRPYGPGGSNVCFQCAFATPERERETEAAFGSLLDANSMIADVIQIGSEEGPIPFNPNQELPHD